MRKKGEKCPVCQGEIKKITVATRGTCYCPTCQRKR
ncbi:MAG: zinc finger domain-containing protein [Longicatena caecimuris]